MKAKGRRIHCNSFIYSNNPDVVDFAVSKPDMKLTKEIMVKIAMKIKTYVITFPIGNNRKAASFLGLLSECKNNSLIRMDNTPYIGIILCANSRYKVILCTKFEHLDCDC